MILDLKSGVYYADARAEAGVTAAWKRVERLRDILEPTDPPLDLRGSVPLDPRSFVGSPWGKSP